MTAPEPIRVSIAGSQPGAGVAVAAAVCALGNGLIAGAGWGVVTFLLVCIAVGVWRTVGLLAGILGVLVQKGRAR